VTEGDNEAGNMEAGFIIHGDLMMIANQQAAEVAEPRRGACDFPAFAISLQAAGSNNGSGLLLKPVGDIKLKP
jgi:hypothetical protein